MSFTEWYEKTQNEKWHEDYALMYIYASDMSERYEKWCKENNVEPVFNG
ncbi:hypothetical protein HXA34_20445 [Salipaludibacillus agaradhaerens]|jgi:hypothetical protein|nr:hypothetical protein [Salipaludibacillus agaradhaerens]MCR6108668.1 hypothetical protein [Salipaludibacillus agaradhaerens]MCR6120692.1 hypothetical protein [Salipaludibacillus agaradhaerens]